MEKLLNKLFLLLNNFILHIRNIFYKNKNRGSRPLAQALNKIIKFRKPNCFNKLINKSIFVALVYC